MSRSIIEWHECDGEVPPPDNEILLTVDVAGDIGLMFWREEADSWDDPNYGWADGIVAWAYPPVYKRGLDGEPK